MFVYYLQVERSNMPMKKMSIRRQVAVLAGIIMVLLLVSYMITANSAKQVIRQKTADANRKLVEQVENSISVFNKDIGKIADSLFYSPTILDFLQTEDLGERIAEYSRVKNVCANTMSLQEGIVGIVLLGRNMEYYGDVGEYLRPEKLPEKFEGPVYSGKELSVVNKRQLYQIAFPIWDTQSRQRGKYLGVGIFIMQCKGLKPFLSNSLVTKNARMALLDQEGNVLAGEGVEESAKLDSSLFDNKIYQITKLNIPATGWTLLNVVPQNELLPEINTIQKYSVVAYLLTALFLAVFAVSISKGILEPVWKITQFAKKFPKEKDADRLSVDYENEMGDLANSLNQMLDEIEKQESHIRESQKRMYEMQLDKKQAEIISYRNQINPHFLYNTLECIGGMASFYQAPRIAEIAESLSYLYRYAVKGEPFVMVKDEIDYIMEYAKIIDCRFMGKIKICVDAERNTLCCDMIKMLLQPLVENAVFHGLERKVGDGQVDIRITMGDGDNIQVEVKDNGIGISPRELRSLMDSLEHSEKKWPASQPGMGIGMHNVYHRLHLFYNDKAEFYIKSKLDIGTVITMRFPARLEQEVKHV